MILNSEFYNRSTKQVAKELLGCNLLRLKSTGEILISKIVETEAYLGINDPACHTYKNKRTVRTEAMYGPAGTIYVYLIYGMHYCLNIVTRDETQPEAVLIRALEPLSGFNLQTSSRLMNGPGKLCRILEINKDFNGKNVFQPPLWIEDASCKTSKNDIISCPRIGVDYAGEASQWPLRFYIKHHPSVSKR